MNKAVQIPVILIRSAELKALSFQHRIILSFVRKIRAEIASHISPADIGKSCDIFWNTILKKHFKREEEIFTPLAPPDDVLLNTMIEDHDAIKTKIEQVIDDPSLLQLQRLADILYYHIQFEERNLYPHIETVAHYN